MTRTEIATQWMINLANDNSHGYDQTNRWGPDYDCASAVITAWETAGVHVKSDNEDNNDSAYLPISFMAHGFSDVIDSATVDVDTGTGLVRGDVLQKYSHGQNDHGHVAMYIGNNQMVHARQNENGGETGGQTGDQGSDPEHEEIVIMGYTNIPYNWDHVLRYTAEVPFDGDPIVQAGQIHANNFIGAGLDPDGHRGPATIAGGIKVLQHALNLDYNAGLTIDGSFGPLTQAALGSHYVSYDETQYLVTAAQILLMLRGFDPNGVESPGHFGGGMLSAVFAFQFLNNLPVTGICDSATFIKLIQ